MGKSPRPEQQGSSGPQPTASSPPAALWEAGRGDKVARRKAQTADVSEHGHVGLSAQHCFCSITSTKPGGTEGLRPLFNSLRYSAADTVVP